jgi:hypothetical protein
MSKNDIYFDDNSFEERLELLEIEEEPIDIPEEIENEELECSCLIYDSVPCPLHSTLEEE